MNRAFTRRQLLSGGAAVALGLGSGAVSAASPEARLNEVYRAMAVGDRRRALTLARALTRDVPGFQLAQLVYGDLLMSTRGPIRSVGAIPPGMRAPNDTLLRLQDEARRRLRATAEEPPAGNVPREVLELADNVRHVVVVDASHSRAYLFEHRNRRLMLSRNFYASFGQAGFDKRVEGDLRTPLGVYHVTSRPDDRNLDELYGIGALPLNYPNELDRRQGRTGSGIWLHGVPRVSYSRSPYATEGCVAMANDDMAHLLKVLEPGKTPVIITDEVQWSHPAANERERSAFRGVFSHWQQARPSGGGIAQLSIFRWRREREVTVVNYTERPRGRDSGSQRRQYWLRERDGWKLFFDGAVG